jgi:hypothetical protein
VQRDARLADEPAGVTHRQPFDRELMSRWTRGPCRLFLVCFDNNDRGAALADMVVRGAARWARAIAAYCIFAKASGAVLLAVALLGCCLQLLVQLCFCVELSQLFYGGYCNSSDKR